jgi:hypothetical protein
MALSVANLQLVDPATGQFVDLDGGAKTTQILLQAILIELRVNNQFNQAGNPGILSEDLNQLRADMASDTASLLAFTATSNF